MRTPLQANQVRQRVSDGRTIPPPVGGWDAISSLENMEEDRAITLDNFFPGTAGVELRRGFNFHAVTSTSAVVVDSLMAYNAASIGDDRLFAAAGTKIYDVTSGGSSSAAVTGLSNARWQHVNFRTTGGSYLFCVNGENTPRTYNGTSWSAPSISGTNLNNTTIIGVTAHKKRLWFTTTNDTKAWYLNVDSIAGAATAFPLGGVFSKGGSLWAIGTWSRDTGVALADLIAFVSSKGQIAIYSGTNPGSDFSLEAVLELGPPIGRRCLVKVGSDLAYICLDGVIPLSQAIGKDRGALQELAITKNIRNEMHDKARLYNQNFGWQLIGYPRGRRALLNVPISEGRLQYQFVMNTETGAWCRFSGQNFNCLEIFQDRLFGGGNDGHVYELDISQVDYGANLNADMRMAFNFFKSPGQNKYFQMLRPLITEDQAITPSLALDVDFQSGSTLTPAIAESSNTANWDSSNWDSFNWADETTNYSYWNSIGAVGQCASVHMTVSIAAQPNPARWGIAKWGSSKWGITSLGSPSTFQLNGFYATMEKGGFL